MSLMDATCPHCGRKMRSIEGTRQYACEACGSIIHLDDQKKQAQAQKDLGRRGAGNKHTQWKASSTLNGSGQKRYTGSSTAQRSAGRSGRSYEQKSYQANMEEKPKKNFLVVLFWIIGWLCFFPLTLTIFILTRKSMKGNVKLFLIILFWMILLQTSFLKDFYGPVLDYFQERQVDSVRDLVEMVEDLPGELMDQFDSLTGKNPDRREEPKRGSSETVFFWGNESMFPNVEDWIKGVRDT